MSSSLYVLFDRAQPGATIVSFVSGMPVSGFALFDKPLKASFKAPGEEDAVVRLTFYAQNYFRIFISDLAIEFYRETQAPPEVIAGERAFRDAVLGCEHFKLRRWLLTTEGWDDTDNEYVQVVAEGTDAGGLEEVLVAP
jgi:hypothetical protein